MSQPLQIAQTMYAASPLVFGHRGAKAYAPMNTLPAFELAASQGAHGIELDVHRSKDGYPVVVHDFTVDATSNGSGLVSEMTLDQLKALDAGSWFSPEFAGTRIPTLDEVFEAVGQKLWVNVEIKSETAETDGIEEVVAECIARNHMENRVIISSFNPMALQRFRAIMPGIPTGFLYYDETPQEFHAIMAEVTFEAYNPENNLIDGTLIATAAQTGRFINAWTVNDAARALELAQMGVHGIITDYPDVILNTLKESARA